MRVRAAMLVECLAAPVLVDRGDPWADLEWAQHPEAIRAVEENPEGMTLEQIGEHMGITRERVRQIEALALSKLKRGEGTSVLFAGTHAIAIPDCEGCGLPFVRRNGRDRRCALCSLRARQRH